jgi:PAS domain S-box-containing protein
VFAALSAAALILLEQQRNADHGYRVWVGCALIAMGVLDGFHAGAPPGELFVWTRSLASLAGGALIALTWLPPRPGLPRSAFPPAFAVATAAGLLGVLSLAVPDAIPPMMTQGAFAPASLVVNALAGLAFFAGAARLLIESRRRRDASDARVADFSLLFGSSGLLFAFSNPWSASWWVWHGVQLAAYLLLSLHSLALYRRKEEERAKLAETVTLLIESTGEGIWGLDLEGRCIFINRAAAQMLGYRPEDVRGRNMHALVHHSRPDGSSYPADVCPIYRAFRTGQSCRILNEVFWRRDGTPIPVEYTSYPVVKNGALTGAVLAFTDITERNRIEEQLRRSQKMDAVGRLAGGVAHDFNNLLTVILSTDDLLLRELDPGDPRREDAEEIKSAAMRAATLTRQLLAFSRQQPLDVKVLDVNIVVAGMGRLLRRLIGEDVALVTQQCRPLGRVRADAGRIEQVIMNLAVNARDAMQRGGTITIETANADLDERDVRRDVVIPQGRYVTLTVRDTGCGIDEVTRARMFDPFFTTKEPGKGTGLGLSTVYGIVTQSGGFIRVDSEPGRGATFTIYLPRCEEAAEASRQTDERAWPAGGDETILLVEDEDAVLVLVQKILTQEGYRVLAARNGKEALRLCGQHHGAIHLLLTDVVMPGMSGRETAARLSLLQPHMKVVYMSGYADDELMRQGVLDQGASFLPKPFTPDVLIGKVREALDSARA